MSEKKLFGVSRTIVTVNDVRTYCWAGDSLFVVPAKISTLPAQKCTASSGNTATCGNNLAVQTYRNARYVGPDYTSIAPSGWDLVSDDLYFGMLVPSLRHRSFPLTPVPFLQ